MARPIYLLDTNIVSEMAKEIPDRKVMEKVSELEALCAISSTTLNEMLYGIQIMPKGKKQKYLFDFVVDEVQSKFPILPYDSHAAWIHSDLRSRLRELGKQVEFPDTQISSIAISNQMVLVSRNTKHFEPVQEVSGVFYFQNWFEA